MQSLYGSFKLTALLLIVGRALLSSRREAVAQSVPTAEPEIVHVTTADGRTLEALYWALPAD